MSDYSAAAWLLTIVSLPMCVVGVILPAAAFNLPSAAGKAMSFVGLMSGVAVFVTGAWVMRRLDIPMTRRSGRQTPWVGGRTQLTLRRRGKLIGLLLYTTFVAAIAGGFVWAATHDRHVLQIIGAVAFGALTIVMIVLMAKSITSVQFGDTCHHRLISGQIRL